MTSADCLRCRLYAFSLFLPTIVQQMGYKSIHAQLLSVPPYAVAAVVTIFVGFVADRTRMRGEWMVSSISREQVLMCDRILQHRHVVLRNRWVRDAARFRLATRPIRGHFPRCDGDLPLYSKHNLLDGE